jgi:arginyl-tRNA synthetase
MEQIQALLQALVKDMYDLDVEVQLQRTDERFGDYATNIALQLSKQLGQNPRDIAAHIAENLTHAWIDRSEVAGPGFINIYLSDAALIALITSEPPKPLAAQTVVAEYSDPNPFKVLHAGHLYTSLVGDAVANLLENAGATVHRVNFGGDVGLHVGRAMWAIIRSLGGEHPEKLAAIDPTLRLEWVSERYVEGSQAYEEDETAKQEIIACNKRVYGLHETGDHDSPFAQIYWTCRQWSYDGFDSLYARLGMAPFEKYYPESQTTPVGISTVEQGRAQGVFEESEGAVVFRGEKEGLHTRVFMTSGGLPTYEAKDLGLAISKWEDYHFDRSVMITGNDIIEYMKVVMAVLRHFHPEIVARTHHMTHGMIRLAGGAKMSSRKGSVLRAADVLDAAAVANREASGKEQQDIVLGAVKYAFLKQRIGGDIIYEPVESVALEGNSGPYLQYAHARARSILRKAGDAAMVVSGPFDEGERSMARKIGEFNEVVSLATRELMPHHIATYLYELAQAFNRFYEGNRVIGDARADVRLGLVAAYAYILKQGLGLLGIHAPEVM